MNYAPPSCTMTPPGQPEGGVGPPPPKSLSRSPGLNMFPLQLPHGSRGGVVACSPLSPQSLSRWGGGMYAPYVCNPPLDYPGELARWQVICHPQTRTRDRQRRPVNTKVECRGGVAPPQAALDPVCSRRSYTHLPNKGEVCSMSISI